MGDTEQNTNRSSTPNRSPPSATVSRCVDWYHEGEGRIIESGGIRFTVRFVGRKGRRARIAIMAPAGSAFEPLDMNETVRSPDRLT
jgi:hypothetical protein